MSSEMAKKCVAELIGTFWLTLGGCGTAVIAASFPEVGVRLGVRCPQRGWHMTLCSHQKASLFWIILVLIFRPTGA